MDKNFIVRPEDFRFAWANIHHLSLTQVADLQYHADIQQKLSLEILATGVAQTKYFRESLYLTGTEIIQQLKKASRENEANINSAMSKLIERADSFYDREVRVHDRVLQDRRQLEDDIEIFEKAKKHFYGQSLWRRLLQSVTGRD